MPAPRKRVSARRACACAAALFVLAGCTDRGGGESPPTPNILVILTDDQRLAGTMEVMPKTAERLGEGGTTYPNAYVTTPVCCPSRASILTGRYAHNHGVRTNEDAGELNNERQLQGYLQTAGYRTSIVGKYLVRPGPYDDPGAVGIDPPNFDDWKIFLGGYHNTLFNIDGELERVSEYPTRYIADSAIDLLKDYESNDAQPWFLYVAPFAPHYPWVPAARYKDAPVPPWDGPPSVRRSDVRDKPDWVAGSRIPPERSEKARNHQLRTLMSVDDLVDRVLSQVDDLDEANDTIVFYLSDNGYHWGEHGLGEKSSPYIDSVRVPFFVRWPGELPEGEVDERLVANIDIAPTVLEAAGIPQVGADPLDGLSLLSPEPRKALLLEHWKEAELNLKVPRWVSLITRTAQYIRTRERGNLREELYDLETDPSELRNVAGDEAYEKLLTRLAGRLQGAIGCAGARCP